MALLCALSASSALAQFTNIQRNIWTGEHDHFSGNTLINTRSTLNNSGSLIYSTSTCPTNTGPLAFTGLWMSGDYWWAMGVLDDGSDGAVINNSGTIQGILSGYGAAQAEGILSLQFLTITNSGTIDGEVLNNDGEADGVWTDSSGTTIINSGTISARSQFLARAVNIQNSVYLVNNGTIQAVADVGMQGITANQSYADCIGVGSGVGIPMYFENNGQLTAMTTSTTATNQARVFPCWANGPVMFKNTGLIYCANFSPKGQAQGFYYGVQSYDIWLYNSGTITNVSTSGNGYALWFENDGDRGNIGINNSGTVTGPSTSLLFLTGHWGPPSVSRTYYTNTGTFFGGQMRFYGIPATIYEAGQLHTTLFGLSDDSYVHVMGLPTIDPPIACGGTNSTLEFNLIGTLQKVNGVTASGTNLTALNLGQSGSIVVSGKTYNWSGAGSVSGIVNPAGYVPLPWQQQDIGSVGVAGGAVYCGGMFTVLASGNGIGGTADAFHYVYQTASNNCSIIAPLTVPQTTNPNAQAGVMIRDSLDASAANAFIGLTATNTMTFQYRSSDGGGTSSNSVTVVGTMHWVKLAQNGNALTGYYSVDGTNWTQLGSTTVSMGSTGYMGLAFCNNNNSINGMGTFYGVTCTGGLLAPSVPTGLTATAGVEQVALNWQAASNTASYNIGRSSISGGPYTIVGSASGTNYTDRNLAGRTTYYYAVTATTPGSQSTNSAVASATPAANVPLPWMAQDLGPVGAVGNESYTNGVFTVSGAGADIDNSESFDVGTQDTFRFVYETNSGNCTVVARVTSVQNIDPESKAGVMIRSGLNSDAANVFVGMTPGIGLVLDYRLTNSAIGTLVNNVTNLTAPYWVSLVQNGTSFSGYYSADGNSWILLGTATVSMTGAEYLGMAVSSRNNWGLCTATFDSVTAPGWPSLAGPTNLTATPMSSGQVNLTWNALANATSCNIKRSLYSGGPYTTIATGVATTNYTDLGAYAIANCYYVVSAVVGGSETANSAEAVVHHPQLTGTVIGTPGSWGGSGNTIAKVFDGDLSTFFDGPDGNGDWLGLYFGASVSNAITQINYCPRSGYEGRMVGGIFQGANQANFSDAVTLYTVATQPTSGAFTSVNITNTSAFRYIRYLSPANGFCNVAELQFYGYLAGASVPLPPAPTGLAAATVSSSQINLAWNTVTNAASYNVKRSTTNNGPYAVIATGVIATNYNDTGLAAATIYFYVVSAVNPGGESPNSVQAGAVTLRPTYTWSDPVTISNLTAAQILGGLPGTFFEAEDMETTSPTIVTAGGTNYTFVSNSSAVTISALNAGSPGSGANFSGTGNAALDTLLNNYLYDGTSGYHTIAIHNLIVGAPYSAQLFAIDDRLPENARTVNYQDPNDASDVSPVIIEGNNDYEVATFIATNSTMVIQENLLNGLGNTTAVVVRRLVPPPPTIITAPTASAITHGQTLASSSLSGGAASVAGSFAFTTPPIVPAAGTASQSVTFTPSNTNAYSSVTFSVSVTVNPAPELGISLTNANLTFSWPMAYGGFTLQSSINLAPGSWLSVTSSAPQMVSNQWQISLPTSTNADSIFYRLAK